MLKKIVIIPIVFLLLSLSSALKLYAQDPVGVAKGGCKIWVSGKGWVEVPCNTQDRNQDRNQDGGGKLNFSSPIVMGFVGGGAGALGGSVITAPNGENQWQTGMALGYGVFSTLSLLTSSKKRSVVENIVLGGLGGSATGYGIALAEKANASPSSPKPDKTMERTLEGAAGGLVVGVAKVIMGGKSKPSLSFYKKKNTLFSCMAIGMSGNRIGILVKL